MLDKEKVLAMAIAVIAEEWNTEIKRVVVRSFNEVPKSSLEKFIEDNHIVYHKYQLEDIRE